MYVIKFANGNMTHLDSNSLPNFQKQGDSKVEFFLVVFAVLVAVEEIFFLMLVM